MPGPYVHAALFCDRVLLDADGSLSAIRIVDRVNVPAEPSESNPARVSLFLLVSMRFGDARPRKIQVEAEDPAGERTVVAEAAPVPGAAGVNIYGQLQMGLNRTGDHWFRVLSDGVEVNRTLLTIAVQPLPEQPSRAQP